MLDQFKNYRNLPKQRICLVKSGSACEVSVNDCLHRRTFTSSSLLNYGTAHENN